MKKMFLILTLCFNIYAGEKPHDLLNSISEYAINIGNGKTNDVYIFVDPMCPHSKKLIKKISENKILQLINSYHIFLYRLPKFESDELSHYIYQSSNANIALLDTMVKDKEINFDDFKVDYEKSKILKEISIVAKKLNIKRRPYLILYEGDTGYCRVSEGTAPCMEEFDFE